ncbi:MAG: hypothetical protein WCG34_07780 [Leptolinea sp.]
MARIKCHYLDCVFIDEGICSAASIEVDPDSGCITYNPNAEAARDDDWEEEEEELEEWEEVDGEDDDDDAFPDGEEEAY